MRSLILNYLKWLNCVHTELVLKVLKGELTTKFRCSMYSIWPVLWEHNDWIPDDSWVCYALWERLSHSISHAEPYKQYQSHIFLHSNYSTKTHSEALSSVYNRQKEENSMLIIIKVADTVTSVIEWHNTCKHWIYCFYFVMFCLKVSKDLCVCVINRDSRTGQWGWQKHRGETGIIRKRAEWQMKAMAGMWAGIEREKRVEVNDLQQQMNQQNTTNNSVYSPAYS